MAPPAPQSLLPKDNIMISGHEVPVQRRGQWCHLGDQHLTATGDGEHHLRVSGSSTSPGIPLPHPWQDQSWAIPSVADNNPPLILFRS